MTDIQGVPSFDAIEGRTSFAVEAPGVWFVRTGVLRVFTTGRVNGRPIEALTPLFEVNAGQAAVGVPDQSGAAIALVGRRSPDAQVIASSVAALPDVARALTTPGDGVALLADWIGGLSRAAAGHTAPKGVQWIEPGASVAAVEEPRAVSSKEAVLWIRQAAGTSHFIGRPDLPIAAGSPPYPVSRAAWIEVQPGGEIAVVDGFAALDDEAWKGLAAFHGHALTCIAQNLDEADRVEQQRFRARAEADAKAVEAALRDLASPLARRRVRRPAPETEAFDTPLMRACHAIGEQIGVTMRPHPDLVRGRPVTNPVALIADASGVRYRRVALKDRWTKKSSEPLLVFRDSDQKPAALLSRGWGGYSMYDPEQDAIVPLDAAAAAALNPFAFMFYRPFPRRALAIRDLAAFAVRDLRREVPMIVAMSVGASVLALLVPYLTGIVFDTIIPSAQRGALLTVAALLTAAALVTALFNLARGFAVLRLQGKLSLSLQGALWDRLLDLPLPFFRQYSAGDLAQRSTAFSQIRAVLSGTILTAVLSGLFSVFSFALLFYYSARLALVAAAMTLVALVFTAVAGGAQVTRQRRISAAEGHIAGIVVEFIGGIAKFRIAGAERRAFVLWVKEFAAQKRQDFAARRISTSVAVFNGVYVVACLGVFFLLNSTPGPSAHDALSTGEFLAFIAAFGQFMSATLAMTGALVGVANVVPLYERASPILQATPEVAAAQTAPSELRGGVEALHLVFRYQPDAPLVLRDVSFKIAPGEYVAFVGPSGCGKSTVFRLLLGFETPVSGAVYYDGADLTGLDARAVRRQIGVALQSGTLLAGSLYENICGAGTYPIEEAWEAARMAGIDEDIRAMPMGMHTMVQSGGGGLSGGQRQRVLIARAIIAKPRLLLFDESTSALDNRTQAIVSESLRTLKATRIVIAHRLSTILGTDRIIVMEQGRIVQSGSYAELMAVPGLFRDLAERQLTSQQ